MIKRLLGIALVGCLLFSFPLLAVDSTVPSLASFLSSNASGAACNASAHKGPDVNPPGEQIIICGPCGPDVSCDYHRPYSSCTVFGWTGTCTPTANQCPQQSNYIECYCQLP
jgi:hypothetical protein